MVSFTYIIDYKEAPLDTTNPIFDVMGQDDTGEKIALGSFESKDKAINFIDDLKAVFKQHNL